MRLLTMDDGGNIALTSDLPQKDIPPYAILSHTWGSAEDEVLYDDINSGRCKSKAGYEKIQFCAQQAKKDHLQHFWVDTCCINKADLAELSEAINCMFHWYRDAQTCYVYMSDVSSRKRDCEGNSRQLWESAFRSSRWLTRGWTLQEFIAPASVEFFSRERDFLGDKHALSPMLEQITGVPREAFCGNVPLSKFSVRDRMGWVASRETTKAEDKLYCLLGIFDVFMSPIYGEGEEHAFKRLKDLIAKEYDHHMDEISISLIGTKLGDLERHNFERIDARQGRYESLMASLRFSQMDDRRFNIKAAYSTTCTWLLQTQAYTNWTDPNSYANHRGFMWIKGKPGAGKSTLIKFAHEHAAKLKVKNEILVSFFFNARGEQLEKSTVGMYRSLLWQILDKAKDVQSVFDNVLESFQVNSSEWTVELLRNLFDMAISCLSQRTVKCFIDALDECDEGDVNDMVAHLEDLGHLSQGRYFVCLASRHYPSIVVGNGEQVTLESKTGHDNDLLRYIQSHLRVESGEFFDSILKKTLEKANGVFMWAVLVIPILNKEYCRGRSFAVEKRLNDIPEGLSELFQNILTRDSTDKSTLLLCLQLILFAKRPLSREEFYFAVLSVSDHQGATAWNLKQLSQSDMDRFIRDSSKGLAELTKAADPTRFIKPKRPRDRLDAGRWTVQVQFIHESVRDFLIRHDGLCKLWPRLGATPDCLSHDVLKHLCLDYLHIGLECSSRPFEDFKKRVKSAQTRLPFFKYAVRHVLYHADQAADCIAQQDFLDSFPTKRWAYASNQLSGNSVDSYSTSPGLLYILADNNAPSLIRTAYHLDYPTYSPDERFGHPFFAALAWHYWDAVRAILDPSGTHNLDEIIGSVEPFASVRRVRKGPLLLWALQERIKPLTKYLLERKHIEDITCRDHSGRDALSWAAQCGSRDVVDRLLSGRNLPVNTSCDMGCTPLHYAVTHGKFAIAELLLDRGAMCDLVDRSGQTALHLAVAAGHYEMTSLLIDHGANINIPKDGGFNALYMAAYSGHNELVKLLLDAGADANARGGYYGNALQAASRWGRRAVVKLLLDSGVNVNAEGGFYGNALSAAHENGHHQVLWQLHDAGAKAD